MWASRDADPSPDDLRRQAEHCRRLANAVADPDVMDQLEAMAVELEQRAAELVRRRGRESG